MKDHLIGFDSVTMEQMFRVTIHPLSDSLSFSVALGSRWLAYPTTKVAQSISSQTGTEKLLGLAKGFASGLYSIGTLNTRKRIRKRKVTHKQIELVFLLSQDKKRLGNT